LPLEETALSAAVIRSVLVWHEWLLSNSSLHMRIQLQETHLKRDSGLSRFSYKAGTCTCTAASCIHTTESACPRFSSVAAQVHAQLAKRGVPLASAQIQISLLSWGPKQRDLIATCAKLGVTPIAYSPLSLGLLTGKYRAGGELPAQVSRAQLFKGLLPKIEPLLAELEAVADERGVSMSQARFLCVADARAVSQMRSQSAPLGCAIRDQLGCVWTATCRRPPVRGSAEVGESWPPSGAGRATALTALRTQVAINWCMCKGTIPIPGVKSMAMACDNVAALNWRLRGAEVAALDDAAAASSGSMVQNIFQTA
jgi:Aldo/keto reductase family